VPNGPGGNVTGFASMTDGLGAKQLRLLHELVPRAERFAVFFNPEREAASTLGRTIEFVPASNAQGIVAGFASLVEKRIDALLVQPNPFFGSRRIQLALFAARHAIPAIYAAPWQGIEKPECCMHRRCRMRLATAKTRAFSLRSPLH
jgi:putative tryptophan/tyrosine transport system substrate-binding protein